MQTTTNVPAVGVERRARSHRNALQIARRHPRLFAALNHTCKVRRG